MALQHRHVDEIGDEPVRRCRSAIHPRPTASRAVDVELRREHGRDVEQRPGVRVEQVVRPCDRRARSCVGARTPSAATDGRLTPSSCERVERSPSGVSERHREAISSMASGRPSHRRQMRPIAASDVVVDRPASGWRRGRGRGTGAPTRWRRSGSDRACVGGNGIGGTLWTCSPGTPSGARLVASTTVSGHRASRWTPSSAHASSTCSQLSRISRERRCRRWSTMLSTIGLIRAARDLQAAGDESASGDVGRS